MKTYRLLPVALVLTLLTLPLGPTPARAAALARTNSAVAGLPGVLPPSQPTLPNFDHRAEAARASSAPQPAQRAAASALQARVPDANVHWDEMLGSPKWVTSEHGFLSGPQGEGRAVSRESARAFAPGDPHRAIKAFLNEHHALFGHNAEALSQARVSREFVGAHNGMRTVVWQQYLDNLPVFEATLLGHITRHEELVSLSSGFVAEPEKAADRGTPNRAALQAAPSISAAQAIVNASRAIGETLGLEQVLPQAGQAGDAEDRQRYTAPGVLKGETTARLLWVPLNRSQLRLGWDVRLGSVSRGEMFCVLIDATTGQALLRRCLTEHLSDATYRVYTSDSPSPFSPGHPAPSTLQPPLVPRVLVVTNAVNTNASHNGWINDGLNETRGNNVDTYLDRNHDGQPDVARPQGSPFRVFDFPLDLANAPETYGDASVVQLFYWCNFMHDKLYELGFTEAAGNFQIDNFGRGGLGNDMVRAAAQHGGATNNASMYTPPDGASPQMEMYLWSGGPGPNRDSALDAEIVLHEYTHGLSNRRVGGGEGLWKLQSRGMGEGWSDFYALALLSESSDDLDGNDAMAAYSSRMLVGLADNNYYFGLRRYPYTADLNKNPLTFKDTDPSQASSHEGIPLSPMKASWQADEVHALGEVWCVTLWEARANLIRKHGFAVGNHLILQLVTDGMNLSPANPNFLEARDAILQADMVDNGGGNQEELWRAFAKRGMGIKAASPSASTTAGVLEDFSLPDTLTSLALTQTHYPSLGTPHCDLTLVLSVSNRGPLSATSVVLSEPLPADATLVSMASSQGSCAQAGGVVTCELGVVPAYYGNATVQLTLRPGSPGRMTNICTVTANEPDYTPANRTSTRVVPVSFFNQGAQSFIVRPGATITNRTGIAACHELTYQWNFNGSPVPDETNATLILTNIQLAQDGYYTLTTSDGTHEETSEGGRLTVLMNPVFTLQPLSQTVTAGSTVTFNVAVSGNPPPFGFRLRRSGVTVTNFVLTTTNCVFTLPNIQTSQAGNYSVVVTNQANCCLGIVSSAATLTVRPPPAHLRAAIDAGTVTLILEGVRGVSYRIDQSTNLPDWQSANLTVTPTSTDGVIRFPAPGAPAGATRLYRAVIP